MNGVKRPTVDSYKGKTPALGDDQARRLLNFPSGESLKDKRDHAILSTRSIMRCGAANCVSSRWPMFGSSGAACYI